MQNNIIYIIILNWNGWEDTVECVKSLRTTACTEPYKILIIDNCSSNDSVERIKDACPEIELIQNESNLGFGGGCNIGLQHSMQNNAEFVWLLNNDTTVYADTLQELINIANTDASIGIVGSVLYYMNAPETVQTWGGGYVNFWAGHTENIYYKNDIPKLQYITGASMLVRVKSLQEAGLFDDSSYFMYWEDADLCFRFSRIGWSFAVAEKSKVLHKEGASLEGNSQLLIRYFNQSAVIFFCKFYRFCLIPVFIGLGGRLIKRIIHKDSVGFKEIALILSRQFIKTLFRIFK